MTRSRGPPLLRFYMNKMINSMFNENDSFGQEKIAFNINIDPGSLIGAVTGATVANKITKNQTLKQQQKNDASVILGGSYYSQVENISNNLKVIFTPLSVIFTVKNGVKDITVETINTEEMNKDMYMAWQNKDYLYFKNLLLNKINSEIQFVEQQFARNIINKHIDIKNTLSKKAFYIPDSISLMETENYLQNIQGMYEKDTESVEKIASAAFSDIINSNSVYDVSLELPRPFSDYSGVSGALEFTKLAGFGNSVKSMQGNFLKPGYLNKKLKVGFFPDRVIFEVDNKAVSTLMAFDMDNDTFEAFDKKDASYFKDLFNTETRLGIKRMNAKIEKKNLIKQAGSEPIIHLNLNDIFFEGNIHPVLYLRALSKKFADKFFTFNANALIKIVEQEFDLTQPIADIPLNKILSIQAVNRSKTPFEVGHAFEKIIRSFSDLPIDWMEKESEDLSLIDLAFGIDAIGLVSLSVNPLETINSEVLSYIVQSIASKGCKYFYPLQTSTAFSPDKYNAFYENLNKFIIDENNRNDTYNIFDEKEISAIISKNEIIQECSKAVLNKSFSIEETNDIENDIDQLISILNLEAETASTVKRTVLDNISINKMLLEKRDTMEAQLALYDLE